MVVKYASGGLIVEQLNDIDAGLSTAPHVALDGIIEQVEGQIDALMRCSTITFDAAKHGLLRTATVALASLRALTYEPGGFGSTNEAVMLSDSLWAIWKDCERLLSDQSVVTYLKGL